jgi:ABC-2 type transport system permease protein
MQYSQIRAMLAITKASFRAITRNPSAVIFSFAFPFIFILVFGFIGDKAGSTTFNITFDKSSDTSNALFQSLQNNPALKIKYFADTQTLHKQLVKGSLNAVLTIKKTTEGSAIPYQLFMKTTSSNNDKWPQLQQLLNASIQKLSDQVYPNRQHVAQFDFEPLQHVEQVREYKTIDFILPGQLGFSLLSAGVFGVAFMFFNLRNTLVLKRFFATPINRTYIILGEGLSRVLFQLITAVVIIVVGRFLFGFTLIHGFITFLEMMVLSFLGLLVFMGFGFIVSGLAKSDSTIPPFANLITLPQFLLGGTFFSIDNFPFWLQPISRALPLTHLNTAMRKIAFEGLTLWDVRVEIGFLMIWGVLVYLVAVKVFKWE